MSRKWKYLWLKRKKQSKIDVFWFYNAWSHVRMVLFEVTLHEVRSD